ncbi:MAG: site-specific DNA-methyltransferase [Acidobacteriales bacterium]|nr:site-specific DNA-methyltransferase [Terriglobales bacterium]
MKGNAAHTDIPASDLFGSFADESVYRTAHGVALLGDSRELLARIPTSSVNLVFTSPPYALHFMKEYGNAHKRDYVQWFIPFAREILRILKDDGSFVLNIGGSYNKGTPTRSLYHFHLLIALVEKVGFHLAQECFWYNPAKMPMPAEWVTVRRVRIKDSVEYVWWLSKTPWPKASNLQVLKDYSPDMIRLNRRGVKPTVRPSGHVIRDSFDSVGAGGAIPGNVVEDSLPEDFFPVPEAMLKFGNNAANDDYAKRTKQLGFKMHPARFPAALPEFFIRLLTEDGDVVVDPFAGSNTTGVVAEHLGRRWIAIEQVSAYLEASRVRFDQTSSSKSPTKEASQAELF